MNILTTIPPTHLTVDLLEVVAGPRGRTRLRLKVGRPGKPADHLDLSPRAARREFGPRSEFWRRGGVSYTVAALAVLMLGRYACRPL